MHAPTIYGTENRNLPLLPHFSLPREAACGLAEGRHVEEAGPLLVRSVVESAGLGRFVYLQGRSGKRYVFSQIKAEQVALYDNALFAVTTGMGGSVRVAGSVDELPANPCAYYVHFIDGDRHESLTDLAS